jgi:hypothetical protein
VQYYCSLHPNQHIHNFSLLKIYTSRFHNHLYQEFSPFCKSLKYNFWFSKNELPRAREPFVFIYSYRAGVALKEGRREKYYLTDQLSLRYGTSLNLTTPNGFWNNRAGWTRAIRADDNSIIGAKKTLNFYTGNTWLGTRTNWVMNVYSVNNEDSFVEVCKNQFAFKHIRNCTSDLSHYRRSDICFMHMYGA